MLIGTIIVAVSAPDASGASPAFGVCCAPRVSGSHAGDSGAGGLAGGGCRGSLPPPVPFTGSPAAGSSMTVGWSLLAGCLAGCSFVSRPNSLARRCTASRSTMRNSSSPSDSRYDGSPDLRTHFLSVLTGIPVAASASLRVTQLVDEARCAFVGRGGDGRGRLPSRSASVSQRVVASMV